MNRLFIAMIMAFAFTAAPVQAQKQNYNSDIDFGSLTCRDFVEDIQTMSEDDLGAILLWLDGYLSGVTGDHVLSWGGFETFAEYLVTHCQRNGRQLLLNAARQVGIEG